MIKKLINLNLLAILFYLSANAQETTPTGYISVGGGFNLPIGEYASTQANDNSAGYAKIGLHYQFTAAIPIAKSRFGVVAKAYLLSNELDENALLDNVIASYPSSYNTSWTLTIDGSQKINSYLGGLYYTIPLNKISIDFRAMAGLYAISVPFRSIELVVQDASGIGFGNYYFNTTVKNSIAYDFGTSLRYSITNHFCLLLNVDLLRLDYERETSQSASTIYYPTNGQSTSTTQYSYDISTKPIALINCGIGFGYQF